MSSRRSSPRSWASPRTKSPHLIVVVVVAIALAHPPTNRYLSLLFPPRCCVAFSSLLLSISFSLSLSDRVVMATVLLVPCPLFLNLCNCCTLLRIVMPAAYCACHCALKVHQQYIPRANLTKQR